MTQLIVNGSNKANNIIWNLGDVFDGRENSDNLKGMIYLKILKKMILL